MIKKLLSLLKRKKVNPDKGFYQGDYWTEISNKYQIKNKLIELFDRIPKDKIGTGIILYGEIYGVGIQGQHYTYGLNTRELALFDIELNKQYLNREEFNYAVSELDLPNVEVLYKGKYNIDVINKLVENHYINGTKVPHEGVVVSHINGDRSKIAKFINPEYLIFSEKNEVPDSH